MLMNKKILLVTIAVAITLSLGTTTLLADRIGKNINNQQNKKSSSQTDSTPQVDSSLSTIDSNTVSQNNAGQKGTAATSSSTNSQSSATTVSNTLTEDDFRSSDDIAYRSIAMYGMKNGDANWKQLANHSQKGIVMTKVANQSNPTFVAKPAVNTPTKIVAYYQFIMNSDSMPATSATGPKPMSFSQSNQAQYRASIPDVLNYVNQVGGQQAIQQMKFQLIQNTN